MIKAVVESAAVPDPRAARDSARFLLHVLTSAKSDDDWFAPIPAKVIEKHCRRADWRALEAAGVIEVRPHSRAQSLCREFRAVRDLRLAFADAGLTAERVLRDGVYNLATGRETKARTKSQRQTKSRNPLPKTIRTAIDAVKEVPFLPHAIERHLDRLRALIDAAETDDERVTAEARYLNDRRCYDAVLSQGARPLGPEAPPGLWVYRPAYKPQRFGRVSQIGGGLQSCSTAMKSVAYPPAIP